MSDEIWLCLGPGMHLPPKPWIAVEAIQRDNHPVVDLVVQPEVDSLAEKLCEKYGTDADKRVTRIFGGHVVEHLAQHLLLSTIREWFDLLATGGEIGIVGPNFYAALTYWKDGLIDLETAIQHGEVGAIWTEERWEQWYRDGMLDSWAMHGWNSTPERTIGVMRAAGFICEHREPTLEGMAGWPVTAYGGAQLAVVGRKP